MKNSKLKTQNSKLNRGFTLIELLIAIAIIGILSTLLMANFIGIRQRARDTQRKSDLEQVRGALELYRSDLGTYPLTAEFPACNNPFTGGSPRSTYMRKVPCDPTNLGRFIYQYSSTSGSTYTLTACLENLSDAKKDETNNTSVCDGTRGWSFTLNSP